MSYPISPIRGGFVASPQAEPTGTAGWAQQVLRDHPELRRALDMDDDAIDSVHSMDDDANEDVLIVPVGPKATQEGKQAFYDYLQNNSTDLEDLRIRYLDSE